VELLKAAQICREVAEESKRWGKHAGFAGYHEEDVREAIIEIHKAGLFDLEGERELRIAARKELGAAKARAARAQNIVDDLRKQLKSLEKTSKA
jgi:hypothetical protein